MRTDAQRHVVSTSHDHERGVPLQPSEAGNRWSRCRWATIRLDDDVLHWFKDQVHAAYQTLINAVLREVVERRRGPRIVQLLLMPVAASCQKHRPECCRLSAAENRESEDEHLSYLRRTA